VADNIISYELYYNDSVQRRGVHVTISPPVDTHLLEDLSPDTVYHIRLSAKSLRGEGVPTATIQVRTLEYGISYSVMHMGQIILIWNSVLDK